MHVNSVLKLNSLYYLQIFQCAIILKILLRRFAVKKLTIAIGVLILTQAYWMIPAHMPDALDWILFVLLLLYGGYLIYDARKTEK